MSEPAPALRRTVRHLARFLSYVLARFPLARVALIGAFVVLTLEYALLSVMIPLASTASTVSGGRIVAAWGHVADAFGFPRAQLTWLWWFVVLTALSVVADYVQLLLSTWLSKQVHRHLAEKIFRRVLFDEPMIDIYRRSIGYYVSLAGDDTYRSATIVNSAFQAFASACSALAGFVLLYLFSPQVFLGAAVFLAISGTLVGSSFRAVLRKNGRAAALSRELGTAYIEGLNGLRSIRSMSSEAYVHRSYIEQLNRYIRLLFQIDATRSAMKLVPSVLLLLVAAVALWPHSTIGTGITVAYVLALTTIFIRIFLSLGQVVQSGSTLLLDVRAAKDIDELVGNTRTESRAPELEGHITSIALRGVSFAYDSSARVLDGFDFRFDAGKSYAITGRSGSGKSTLADMLLGLIRPDGGEVFVNDCATDPATLRHRVVLVEQQARVFSASVRENLLLGMKADDEALWDALRAVDLESFVRALAQGLDTQFQYQGANLSGGQRQRLGIARALLRKPEVLILDEATSALDAETRRAMVAHLRERFRAGTLIFITHEAAIAEEADVRLAL